MEDLWLMTTAHIAKFSGGVIHITSSGGGGGSRAATRVWTDETNYTDIPLRGELTGHTAFSIAYKVEIGTDVTSIGDEAFY